MIKKFIYIIAFQFIKYVSCTYFVIFVWKVKRTHSKTAQKVRREYIQGCWCWREKQIKIKLSDEIKQNLINHIVVYIHLGCVCVLNVFRNILQPNFITLTYFFWSFVDLHCFRLIFRLFSQRRNINKYRLIYLQRIQFKFFMDLLSYQSFIAY